MTCNIIQAAEVSGMIASDVVNVNDASIKINLVSVKLAENSKLLAVISDDINNMISAFKF